MKIGIKERKLTEGKRALYLEYYETGFRKRENLHLYLLPDDAVGAAKHNRLTYNKAMEIRAERILTPPVLEKENAKSEEQGKFRIGAYFVTLNPQDRAKLAASIAQSQQMEAC